MAHVQINNLLAVGIAACALAACGEPVDSSSEEAETFGVTARDGKTDSVLTHELRLSIDESQIHAPRDWLESTVDKFRPRVEVVDYSDTHVSVETDEIIFRPPLDMDRQDGEGWLVFLSGNKTNDLTTLDFGTAFSIMAFHRPRGSDDAWTPIEMPHPDDPSMSSPYFQAFASGEAEDVEEARVSEIPDGRCAVVHGHSRGSDYAVFNSKRHLPELDGDGENEFRILVVPSFNFCEWEEKQYLPEIVITPTRAGWYNTM